MNTKIGKQSYLFFLALILVACARTESSPPVVQTPTSQTTVLVSAGWFLMGENNQRKSNQPQRRVYLDTFYIHISEVTRNDFASFAAATGYQAQGWDASDLESNGNLPMVNTVWEDADVYCRWLGMRLPTEAEWEKAARGEDGRRYPWGNDWDNGKANTAESSIGTVLPVGSFPEGVSPYGVSDMAGNAAEWVSDYFDPTYYTYAFDHNPPGPDKIMDRVLRGGSFAGPSTYATTYFRDSSHSVRPNLRVGFRCAESLK